MPNVLAVKPNPKKPEQAYVTLEGLAKDAWCPNFEAASKLEIGKPLPEGWDQSEGEYGPRLFPPKDKKNAPQAAFRNTRDGQAIEQERMDRRTALMQAVSMKTATVPAPTGDGALQLWYADLVVQANAYYAWLRETSGAAPLADRNAGVTTAPYPSPGKSAQASRDDATPASLPASEHLAGVSGAGTQSAERLGKDAKADEEAGAGSLEGISAPAPSNYLAKEEQRVFARAFGGQVAAVKAARERFGDRVRGLDDLTREMATELVAAKVSG